MTAKTAWVFTGGGARIVQGLKLIRKAEMAGEERPDIVVGSSSGGLLATMIARGFSIRQMEHQILTIKNRRDVFKGNFFWGAFSNGLWSPEPLIEKISGMLNKAGPEKQCKGFVCSFDLTNQQKTYINVNEKSDPKMLASTACIPLLVEPIEIEFGVAEAGKIKNNKFSLVDGGLVEMAPLKHAINLGAERIILFSLSATEETQSRPPKGKFEIAMRSYEAMRMEIALNDSKICLHKNDQDGYRKIDLVNYIPSENIIDVLDFDKMFKAYRTPMSSVSF